MAISVLYTRGCALNERKPHFMVLPPTHKASIAVIFLVSGTFTAHAEVGLAATFGSSPFRHVQAFQEIADTYGGNRAAGTPGYDRSADYVANRLRNAGYKVRLEEFTFPFFDERSPPLLVAGPTHPSPYTPPSDGLRTLRNSGSGEVTARLQGIDLNLNEDRLLPSMSGCEREDFAGFVPGHVALIRRGTCPFQLKVEHAQAAGAAGVIIMNQGTEGQTGAFAGSLAAAARIPVLGVPTEVGLRLAAATQEANGSEVHLKIEAETGTRSTRNVIAERDTMSGSFVVVGAHLDSVPEGPGMNDNASGSAAVLESALRLAGEPATGVLIRFAFWGAEERGLLGSRHHLSVLPEQERRRIALYINLDMVGSPNFGRFIQHTSENSSGLVARTVASLNHSFAQHSLPVEERTTRSRGFGSDDASFANKGIPTISLFTGAGGAKNGAQAQQFGGSAGQPFDSCYHKACDTVANISEQVLKQMTDALTNALNELASH
jgi:Zn-dependent M28 family amino/carboxypeptidase